MPVFIMFSIASFLFAVPLLILYYHKKPVPSFRNHVFLALLIMNVIGLGSEICTVCFSHILPSNHFLLILFEKLIVAYFFSFGFWFFVYFLHLCAKKWQKRYLIEIFVLYFIILCTVCFLPLYAHYNSNHYIDYTFGLSVNVLFSVAAVEIVGGIVLILLNIKRLSFKDYVPYLAFILFILIACIVEYIFPNMLLVSSMYTLILAIMVNTIENPDLKLIQQLKLSRQEADKANEAKSDFLSGMSHDIRTPLNAIVGFSEYLGETNDIEEARENAQDIVHASHTLLDIVNGILDVSKIEAGQIDIVEDSYESFSNFEELEKLIAPRMKEKGLDFSFHISESVPKYLYGDISNLKKVVTNLLSNACKYTDKGFVRYNIDAVVNGDDCQLLISVEDSGQGIKKDELSEIFQKFSRLDVIKNNAVEGTGLGLALSKEIIELMGGKISLESEYGKGSKFTITLHQKVSENEKTTMAVTDVDTVDLSGVKILVVDDSPLNLRVEKLMLEEFHADQITTCDSGFECMKKITLGDEYDLILMDDIMPKMNGLETCKRLKDIAGFHIPIIVVTANAITGMRERYLSSGFDEYLSKPLEKKEMIRIFSSILNNKKNVKEDSMKQFKVVNGDFEAIN